MSIRVAVVADHGMIRDGIRRALPADFTMVGEAASSLHAFTLCDRLSFDVMIIDYDLPDLPAVDLVMELMRRSEGLGILMLVPSPEQEIIIPLVRAGVHGIVSKTDTIEQLITALRKIHSGSTYYTTQIAGTLVSAFQTTRGLEQRKSMLSPRETQTLRLIAQGKSTKDIAVIFQVSCDTVRGYRKTLMKKMRAHNVAELINQAYAVGLIERARSPTPPTVPSGTGDPPLCQP